MLRRFPLLATVADEIDPDRTAPRELFYSQMYLFDERPSRPLARVAPTRGLDDYIFSLQIECTPHGEGDHQRETIFVGIGSPMEGRGARIYLRSSDLEGVAVIEFHPPADVFARVADHFYDRDPFDAVVDIRARVMATKRFEKGRARLGESEDVHPDNANGFQGTRASAGGFFIFDNMGTMQKNLRHLYEGRYIVDWMGEGPELMGRWSSSGFTFEFLWRPNDGNLGRDMTVEDVCLALEHYVAWV